MRPMTRSALLLAGTALALAGPSSLLAQSADPMVFVGHWLPTDPDDADDRGTVRSVRVRPDGSLKIIDTVRVGDDSNSLAISPDGRRLAVGGGFTGSLRDEVLFFDVGPRGLLTPLFAAESPNSAFEMVWLTNDRIVITETNTARSFIHAYFYQESNERIIRTDQEETDGFTTSLVYDEARGFLYSQESTASQRIQRWNVDLVTGRLTLAQEIFNFDLPLDLEITPDGRFLYCGGGSGIFASGCNSCINGYDISDDEGVLALSGNAYFTPNVAPARLGATTNGYLAVGHGGDAVVRTFRIEDDGDLTDTGFFFDLGSQGDLGRVRAIGDRIFVTDDSGGTTTNPIRGLYSFTVNADGSMTQNGDVVDTGRTPDAVETWTGTGEVLCPCEFDDDPTRVSIGDLLTFIAFWLDEHPVADADDNNDISVLDLLTFLECWLDASSAGTCS